MNTDNLKSEISYFSEFVRNFIAAGADKVARIVAVVAHSGDDDVGYIAIMQHLLIVIVPLQIEIDVVLLHQIGDFVGLFERHFTRWEGGIIVFEEICVRGYNAVAIMIAFRGKQRCKPVVLRSAERAISRVENDEKILLRRRAHRKPIGGRVKIVAIVVPLLKIEIVVANSGENGVVALLRKRIETERWCKDMERIFFVHTIAIDDAKIGSRIVAQRTNPLREVLRGLLGMHVAAHIESVRISRHANHGAVVLVVPRERLRHALIGGVARGRNKTEPIDITRG